MAVGRVGHGNGQCAPGEGGVTEQRRQHEPLVRGAVVGVIVLEAVDVDAGALGQTHRRERDCHMDTHLGHDRPQCGRAEHALGLPEQALGLGEVAAVNGHRQQHRQRLARISVRPGPLHLLLLEQRITTEDGGGHQQRPRCPVVSQPDRLLGLDARLDELAGVEQCGGQVHPRRWLLWRELRRFPQQGDRLLEVALRAQQDGEVDARGVVVGKRRQRDAVGFDGLLRLERDRRVK